MSIPSHYRRPLPRGQIPFASADGRALFREALESGTAEGFFALIEQFHTQADPSFCGLGSLVMALNALEIDPGRLWRGPWRWFSEELLDCCTPLDRVRLQGISMDELACLARCNGAEALVHRPNARTLEGFREDLRAALGGADAPTVLIASYSRRGLEQTGAGHFSPIGAYHPRQDLALVLDVARFKYPPHWVRVEELYAAMRDNDPATGEQRGWVALRRGSTPSSLRYFIRCPEGLDIGVTLDALVARTRSALAEARPQSAIEAVRVAVYQAETSGLAKCLVLREPETPEHRALFEALRCALARTALYETLRASRPSNSLEVSVAWLLAAPAEMWATLEPQTANELGGLIAPTLTNDLSSELRHLRSQIEFVLEYARRTSGRAALESNSGKACGATQPIACESTEQPEPCVTSLLS